MLWFLTLLLTLPLDEGEPPSPADREERDQSAVSTKMLSEAFGYKTKVDYDLRKTSLSNRHDTLVFVPGMKRFSVNGLVLPLNFAPFYQGDRLYVPVEVISYINTPMPDPERLPRLIRSHVAPLPVAVRSVFIDAGHGGHDPGAIGPSGLKEKDVTLDVALNLRKLFERSGVKVFMSRTSDCFVALEERARRANRANTEIFISIHVNAAPSRSAVGVETFHLGYAGPPGSPGSRAHKAGPSNRLASAIQRSLVSSLGTIDRGVKQRNFNVLRNTTMPAVLVEVGFLSHPQSERLLSRSSYRRRLAAIIHRGVALYSRR